MVGLKTSIQLSGSSSPPTNETLRVVNFIEQIGVFTTKMTTSSSKSSDNYNYSDHYHDNADDF
jgi:hypothetical protein